MDKDLLILKYASGSSMTDIAKELGCSVDRVKYWMDKHKIERRSISEAIYAKHNPTGDPFKIKPIKSRNDAILWGIGIGLFWGEGNKADKYSVRLGNTDPKMLLTFIDFLVSLCGVDKSRLKFSLQIFTDIEPEKALHYWVESLDVITSQFYKVTVTISGSLGTYRKKSPYGVVQVYFHNKKLRDYLLNELPT